VPRELLKSGGDNIDMAKSGGDMSHPSHPQITPLLIINHSSVWSFLSTESSYKKEESIRHGLAFILLKIKYGCCICNMLFFVNKTKIKLNLELM